jgi:hypothetical protein
MPKRSKALLLLLVVLTLTTAIPLGLLSQNAPPLVRVLVVDETKTFASTMRVAGLVGALRSIGQFDVGVVLADVVGSYDDPLADRTPEEGEQPYDLIVILPRGLDDGSMSRIWVVSAGLSSLPPIVTASLDVLTGVLDQVFTGIGEAIDVSEDLWPCLLWATYSLKGWIR